MGLAMKNIREGSSVIDAQLDTGYESSSGFRDAFAKIMGSAPTRANTRILKAAWLDTKLGPMIAIADDEGLYLLEFVDRRGLENGVKRLRKKTNAAIIPGETPIIKKISAEIADFFDGKKMIFNTPIHMLGSPFQIKVWEALQKIPAGETRSYLEVAQSIRQPTACRAVARANGSNPLAIIVPCHRVINHNGNLGGYGGGITRKQWLLDHEK